MSLLKLAMNMARAMAIPPKASTRTGSIRSIRGAIRKRTIKVINEVMPELSVAIIGNSFATNHSVDRLFREILEADDLPVLGTVPTAAAFKQGAALGKPVYEIAKNGKAAQAIENILNELEEVL